MLKRYSHLLRRHIALERSCCANPHVPRTHALKQILEWLDYGEDQRPTFLTLYFEGVDKQGHSYGPGSVG